MIAAFVAVLLCLLCSVVQGCDFEGCDHVDFGSCGTACCRMGLMIINETPEEVMAKLNLTIAKGGPDHRYIPMRTAQGNMTFTDLRERHPEASFLGQTIHTTKNLQYNDTLNLLLKKEGAVSTKVFAVSVSQVAGAYGDKGQNYFNIKQLFDGIKWEQAYQMMNMDESCPGGSRGSSR
jgi:hypothetical protein